MLTETEFEKRRGVSRVEVRSGYSQIHVEGLEQPVMEGRLRVLRAVADLGVSIDFLKLSPSGLSFLAANDRAEELSTALEGLGVRFELRRDRTIVLVHAVNIRDEEGLLADIVRQVISLGVVIDHVGDMHDRLLLVLEDEAVDRVRRHLEQSLLP